MLLAFLEIVTRAMLRQRLRQAHWLTTKEIAAVLGVSCDTVKAWRGHGRLRARHCNDKQEWLHAPLREQPLVTTKKRPPAAIAGQPAESL
jgi:hypothetical protein